MNAAGFDPGVEGPPDRVSLTPSQCASAAGELYRDGWRPLRILQRWRPHICPFHLLVSRVPVGANVLDVGCGGGLFLGLLARFGRLGQGRGFDTSPRAIAVAERMRLRLGDPERLRFDVIDARGAWPEGYYDVVSMIDLMHHVPPEAQADVVSLAARRVGEQGVLLYKDMVRRPRWRAWANRAHDLLLARQWIHEMRFEAVTACAEGAGLRLVEYGRVDMAWYGHEYAIFRHL